MPSWELFERQPQEYRDSVLPPPVTARVVGRAGVDASAGSATSARTARCIGMHTFGASAPLKELQKKFGFTPDRVVEAAREQLARARASK